MTNAHILLQKQMEYKMGRLIIDGNSVFEIDEECVKKRRLPKNCDIDKYLKQENYKRDEQKFLNKKKSGDG